MLKSNWSGVELVIDSRCSLSEGPTWDSVRSVLLWVSILEGEVHAWDPASGKQRMWRIGQPVGAVSPMDSGGLLLAIQDGIASMNYESGVWELVAPIEKDRLNQRMNDAKCDPRGRFWAGTMSSGDPVPGSGTLYRYVSGEPPVAMVSGVTISNGLGWSPEGTFMYYVDTPRRQITVFPFDLEVGAIGEGRALLDVPENLGYPDGLCVDTEGCIWLALWGPGLIHRYSPSGEHIGTVNVPISATSSCSFGGADLSTLFITTARLSLTPQQLEDTPHAGGVFAVDVGIKGCSVPAFAG